MTRTFAKSRWITGRADKLRTSGKPYWRSIDIGLHLGYRKGVRGAGGSCAAILMTESTSSKQSTADDNQDADDREILTFHQAQKKNPRSCQKVPHAGAGGAALTVKDAIEAYLQGKRGRDQHLRLTRHVLGMRQRLRRTKSHSNRCQA